MPSSTDITKYILAIATNNVKVLLKKQKKVILREGKLKIIRGLN